MASRKRDHNDIIDTHRPDPLVWTFSFADVADAVARTAALSGERPPLRTQLEEWRAIAQAELGFPPEAVRTAFEAAVRLDPSNERASGRTT